MDYKQFNEFLNSMPLEDLQSKSLEEAEKTAREFEQFKSDLLIGKCSFCNESIDYFWEEKPCLHWLLRPSGFRTRHFPLLYSIKSFHNINPYLRWVANAIAPARNINDLVDGNQKNKIIEETIRYKNLEWSFSCSASCFLGKSHPDPYGNFRPHYHFQMKINGQMFIRYGQFHIPFTEYDDFCFAVKRGEIDRLKGIHIEGAGMQTVIDTFSAEELLDKMVTTEDLDNASFNTQTLITHKNGGNLSGELYAELLRQSKEKRIPIAKVAQDYPDLKVSTVITPGPGVPDIAARTPKRRHKK